MKAYVYGALMVAAVLLLILAGNARAYPSLRFGKHTHQFEFCAAKSLATHHIPFHWERESWCA